MKLFETVLPQNYSKGLFEEKNMDLAAEHTDKIADVLFTGAGELLNAAKSKDRPTALVFEKIDNSVIAACIVQFFENEDASKPGNWNMVWTFSESDIPENTLRISLKNPDTHSYFRAIAGQKYGMKFKDPSCLITTMTYLIEQIRKWLDENAEDGKVISVECEPIFQARVEVENGEKLFALEADGEIKQLIKDDASIEK